MMESFGPSAYDAAYHYHSIYDSQRWMEIYGDPGFYNHVSLLSNSLVWPIDVFAR